MQIVRLTGTSMLHRGKRVSYARCSISCYLFVAEESINAKAFVTLEEEELKELGVSFGGRKILRKLMEELK